MNSELEIRVLKNLQTHLNRRRDFAGTLGSISNVVTSIGRVVVATVYIVYMQFQRLEIVVLSNIQFLPCI